METLQAYAKQKASSSISPLNRYSGPDRVPQSWQPEASSNSDESMPQLESDEGEKREQAREVERELRHQRAVHDAATYGRSFLETLNEPDIEEGS